MRLMTVPLTVCVRVDCELAAASASSIAVFRGMMPGSVVAVTAMKPALTTYSATPPTVASTWSDGQTRTQKTREMASVRSAAKSVTPMSGPNMNLHVHKATGEHGAVLCRAVAGLRRASDLPSQQKVCEPSHDCHTLVLWLVE